MIASELLEDLTRRGVYVWTEGEALRYRAPEKALDSRLRSEIVRLKPEILDLLRRREAAQPPAETLRATADPERRHDPFPLTDIQEAYWIGTSGLLELGDVSAHTYQEFDFPSLDLPRFDRAWRRLVERHEMLRAVVLPDGTQRILPAGDLPPSATPVEYLRGLAPDEVERRSQEVRRRMSAEGPDPGRWPSFEIRALVLGGGRVRLAISVSLLFCDALSFRVLLRELRLLYARPDAALEDLDLSFRDYVLALDGAREAPTQRRAVEYWTSRLETLPPGPDLPLAQNPGLVRRPEFRRHRTVVPAAAWAGIRARARRCGVTPTVVLATAYAEILAAWSGSRRFTLNLLFFNRRPVHPQVESVVGNFSSTILLEVDAAPVESFEQRARRLQRQLWRDIEHSQVSGVRVLREWNRARPAAARIALPVVLASTLDLAAPAAGEPGAAGAELHGTLVYGCLQTPQVWLDHQASEQEDGGLVFNWDVVEALFPRGMVDAMVEAYRGLLDRLAASEAAWGLPVPPLTPAAELARHAAINATEAPLPEALLHDLFARRAAAQPGAPAVIAEDARLTYAGLDRASAHWARRLRDAGTRPGELVAVVMEKGWEQVVAVLAVLRAGAAYLPADPSLPAERLAYLLTHAGARRALTQPRWVERLDWPAGVELLAMGREPAGGDPPRDELHLEPSPAVRPGDLAYVLYTSGSTGLPKGVAIDHRGPVNTVADVVRRFGVGPQDRVLALSSLSFDLSVFDLFGPLASGGAVVVPSAEEEREPARWTELVRRERVTIWNSVPALMGMWVDYLEGQPAGAAPACLRLVLLSGDWIPVSLPERVRALFPHAQVVSLGGATEASIWSILYPIGDVDAAWQSIPYGRPMANQRMCVLDDRLEHRPTWVPGELYIGGAGVALGYWRDEERTRRSFPRHPRTGERLYRTGDLGRYLPDGEIEFLGRRDFQVKVQGYRIELGEVEAALSRHPGVGSAVVAALGEPRGEKRLVAYVVPSAEVAAVELREHLRSKLPDYMVPASFLFLEALPLTANGKVDRSALARLETARPEPAGRVPPRDHTEAALAEVWQELLGQDTVGVTDDFFELGGQSLLAVRLMARIRSRFGRDLPLASLVSAPTIERLARLLAEGAPGKAVSPLVPLQPLRPGSRPPFFCVHPVGGSVLCYADLARRLGRDQPFFGLQLGELAVAEAGVEALAECYLAALGSVQPSGPYRLGGWSMGAVVAFEMARRLAERREQVALLALIDAAAPAAPEAGARRLAPDLSADELLAWWAADLWGLAGSQPPVSAAEPGQGLAAVLERAQGAGVLPAEVDLATAERLFAVFGANARALRRFAPRPYPGRALLVRARGGARDGDARWGWGALAAEVDVRWVDGDHFSCVQEPGVAALAELLAESLGGERA